MRALRPNLPGAVFHITSRTVGKEHWFKDALLDGIVHIIAEECDRFDGENLAYVVMPNHLHLLLRQAGSPIGRLMQRICRRVALSINAAYEREGHALERRYRAKLCAEPEYLRNAITYIHLNPVRWKLCDDVAGYKWSSHRFYCGDRTATAPRHGGIIKPELELFADQIIEPQELRARYQNWVRWRRECDQCGEDQPRPPQPATRQGDAHWFRHYGGRIPDPPAQVGKRVDLRDIALRTLDELCPGVPLTALYGGNGSRQILRARKVFIRRGLLADYRGCQIARFLGVSDAVVSREATVLRAEAALTARGERMNGKNGQPAKVKNRSDYPTATRSLGERAST